MRAEALQDVSEPEQHDEGEQSGLCGRVTARVGREHPQRAQQNVGSWVGGDEEAMADRGRGTCAQRNWEAIREVISGHQWSSVVISGH
jgi:ribosome modulation factor